MKLKIQLTNYKKKKKTQGKASRMHQVENKILELDDQTEELDFTINCYKK